MLTYANTCCDIIATPWQRMQSMKSMDFNGCSMARPFLSLRRVWLVRLTKEGSFVPMHPIRASQREMVWWTKSNFLGLLPKSGKDQWDCEISNYYVHTSLTTVKFVHLNSSILTFFERVVCKMFWTLLGYTVTKVYASRRIQPGSPDSFSSWEGGVWGQN